uniref:Nucleoporin Ndc1 n=1 Tax=Lygus hesperus TaxID=30085 RepID=A0A146LRF5_LYGHE
MDPVPRRMSYGQSTYNPLARVYRERGIDACLAVNPLGSVDLGDTSATVTSPVRNVSNGSSFWNDRWRSTEEEKFSMSHQGNPEGTPNLLEEEEQFAFYPPRKFGIRDINLSHYYSTRFTKVIIAFAATHCFLLLAYRILAITFLISGSSSILWTVPYFFSIIIASFLHCTIYLRDYIKPPFEVDTRFKAFLQLFTLENLFEWLKYALGGSLISWVFAAQLGSYYQGPVLFTGDLNKPDLHTKYLNEECLYVIISGAWFGSVLFFQRYFDFTRPRIKFSIIQRLKFQEFKAKARPTLKKSFRKSVWPAVWFTVAYHFFLYDVKSLIVTMSLFLESSTLEIDHTWYQFFNVRRFLVVYLSGVLTVFSFRMAKILMRIFMLTPQEFGIDLFDESQCDLSLSEAIGDSRVPLVRALAFRYLLSISQGQDPDSKDKRKKIFSLNPAGDVPAEWRTVSCDCLGVIEEFSAKLESLREIAVQKGKWSDDVVPVLPRHLAMQAMRKKAHREELTEKRKAMNPLERLSFELRQLASKMPWLMYIFDCEKENQFLRLTRDCQVMLFSVRVLSCLVSCSILEDRFGVVQRDIPMILATLNTLKDKLVALRRVSPPCAGFAVYVQRSLLRIWLSFPDSYGADGLRHFC